MWNDVSRHPLCVHSRSINSTQIAMSKTPKLLSKCLLENCKLTRRKLWHYTWWPLSRLDLVAKQTTEALYSVASKPTDPMWSQNRTTKTLQSVAVEWMTKLRYTAKPCIIVMPIQNLCETLENTATMLYRCMSRLLTGSKVFQKTGPWAI